MLDCGLKFLIYEVKPPAGCGSLVDKLFGLQLRPFEGCQFDLWPVHVLHVGDQNLSQGAL